MDQVQDKFLFALQKFDWSRSCDRARIDSNKFPKRQTLPNLTSSMPK
jgi:hypothetical protein